MIQSVSCPECHAASEFDAQIGKYVCVECEVEFVEGSTNPVDESDKIESVPEKADGDAYVSKLPPKFLADDPDFVDFSLGGRHNQKILLPDGSGGVTSVQQNIVKIQHKGKTIELVALSPDEKRKRQLWINTASIGLGILLMVLFFWLIY